MQKLIAIAVLLLVLFQSTIKTSIVTYFYINQDYIAETKCENKQNIALQCKGKCYLNKKIKSQEEPTSNLSRILKDLNEISGFVNSENIFHSFDTENHSISLNGFYFIKNYPTPLSKIIQPPC